MIAELVKFKVPEGTSRDELLALARETTPGWAANPDLLRKHYLLDDEGFSYGFYLWKSRNAAEAAHGEAFRARVRQMFGCEPTSSYFDVLLNLDNVIGTVTEDLVYLPSAGQAS
ncbi:MAG: hypothetical protein WCI74_18835 [Actinomycetes bacterium]|jgi:hypothetical protein